MDAEGWVRCVDDEGALELIIDRRYATSCSVTIRRVGERYKVSQDIFGDGAGPSWTSESEMDRAELIKLLDAHMGDGSPVRRVR